MVLEFCSTSSETSGLSAPTLQNLRPRLYPTRLAECCGYIGNSCVSAATSRHLHLGQLAEAQVQVVEGMVERGRAKEPGMVQVVLVLVVLVQEMVGAVLLHSTYRRCKRNHSYS